QQRAASVASGEALIMRRSTSSYTRAAIRAGDAPIVESRDQSLVYRERIFVPLWVTMLGQFVAGAWRLLVQGVRLAVRHPWTTASVVALGAAYRVADWIGPLALVLTVAAVGGLWWWRWPASFERRVATRVRTARRFRHIYRPTWRELMGVCGLMEATETGET